MTKKRKLHALWISVLCFSCVMMVEGAAPTAGGTEPPTLTLVFLDLTKSTPPREHEQNMSAVQVVLSQFEPGRVMVFAITESTFAHPEVLVDQDIPAADENDPFFRTRVVRARQERSQLWNAKRASLTLASTKSDVLGAPCLAARFFKDWPGRKRLIIFSDMRHSTPQLDIEHVPVVPPSALDRAQALGLLPPLQQVEVVVLGVHTFEVTPRYADTLAAFWAKFFQRAGASLHAFTPSRNVPTSSRFPDH